MVTVIDYSIRKNKGGEPFCSLILHGGIVMVKSKESGKYYATIQKCSIPSTFDEQTCKSLIGEKIPGTVQKQTCESYEFADKETGEVIELSHRWVYLPENASMEEAIFEGTPQAAIL
jgi:hypothetical protein